MSNISTRRLFLAIDECDLENFEDAIGDYANVNALDNGGSTPLMNVLSAWAIDGDHEAVYKSMVNLLLLHRNIDINAQNIREKNTALHMAISFKNLEMVKLLLRHPNIDFSIRNNYEVTAEMYDIAANYTVNTYNCTALEYARKLGTSEIVSEIRRCMNERGIQEQGRIRLSDDAHEQLVRERIQAQINEVGRIDLFQNSKMEFKIVNSSYEIEP